MFSRPGKKQDRGVLLMLTMIALLAVVLIVQFAYVQSKPTVHSYLDYPAQRVLAPEVDGHKVVSVKDGVIRITAMKCNRSDKGIALSGVSEWQSVEPPGVQIVVGHGSTTRPPGCVTAHYENPIPAAVVKATKQMIARDPGRTYVTWRLAGVEKPDNPLIAPESWQSEDFDVYLKKVPVSPDCCGP